MHFSLHKNENASFCNRSDIRTNRKHPIYSSAKKNSFQQKVIKNDTGK